MLGGRGGAAASVVRCKSVKDIGYARAAGSVPCVLRTRDIPTHASQQAASAPLEVAVLASIVIKDIHV